jgi:hypothetical protein
MLAAAALAAVLSGCGDSGPPRAAIEGEVTIGGEPLKSGRIIFAPQAPTEGPATTVAIVNGHYCVERANGPLVGQHLVRIESDPDLGFALDDEEAFVAHAGARPLPPSPIPPEFSHRSQLMVEVKADQENKFDVPIPVATHSAARPAY